MLVETLYKRHNGTKIPYNQWTEYGLRSWCIKCTCSFLYIFLIKNQRIDIISIKFLWWIKEGGGGQAVKMGSDILMFIFGTKIQVSWCWFLFLFVLFWESWTHFRCIQTTWCHDNSIDNKFYRCKKNRWPTYTYDFRRIIQLSKSYCNMVERTLLICKGLFRDSSPYHSFDRRTYRPPSPSF